jgi:CDP-paratose 2-epimerase
MHEHILITGGAGFVGSSLAVWLRRQFPGTHVTVLDNLHRRGSPLNLPRLAAAGVEFVHGDVRRPEDLEGLRAPGLIIECSAEASVQAGYNGSPEYLVQSNLVGCFHCLELARRVRADFLFLSTSRVYPVAPLKALRLRETATRFELCPEQPFPGASAEGISEAFPLEGVRSLYGMTKLSAELMAAEYADAYGVRSIINRCGLIAGPWQMGKSDQGVVALWAAAHHFQSKLSYIGFGGSGKQVRDILHIDDLCELVAEQAAGFDRYAGMLFNVGGGAAGSLSLVEMSALCGQITGHCLEIGACAEERPADIPLYITDHRRVTAATGWQPRRDPRTTLADICQWIRDHETLLRPVLAAQNR